jgi:hypothetical protein
VKLDELINELSFTKDVYLKFGFGGPVRLEFGNLVVSLYRGIRTSDMLSFLQKCSIGINVIEPIPTASFTDKNRTFISSNFITQTKFLKSHPNNLVLIDLDNIQNTSYPQSPTLLSRSLLEMMLESRVEDKPREAEKFKEVKSITAPNLKVDQAQLTLFS